MARARFKAVWLAVAVAIICGCSFAQDQESNEAPAKPKWLTCFVDWIFTPYDVSSEFSVTLSFRQAPLPGIRVVLTPGGELADANGHRRVPVTAVTDSNGTAHFFAVPAGKYTAGAKNGYFFSSNEVTVHTDGDFDTGIEIEWPFETLPVRALRGKLIAPGDAGEEDQPLQSAAVKLLDLRSSRVVETQRTAADGSYEFSTVEPGLYVVQVIPPANDRKSKPASGDLAVELDPTTALESTIPELKVLQSDCAGVQLLRKTAKGEWEEQ
jgi:hypothetical protein